MQNKCNETKIPHSPYGQLRLPINIPNDPRRKCKGCEPKPSSVRQNAQKKTAKEKVKPSKTNTLPSSKAKAGEKLSSSESGLNFLPVSTAFNNENIARRSVRYQENASTSFGAHLLGKSGPMYAQGLDEKLNFKRDSDAGKIITHQKRKLTQPSFINQVDSEELAFFRDTETNGCPPAPLIRKNFFHNQFLTTGNRAKEGLKYVMAANYPRLPPDPPTGGSPPIEHEIKDECGRKTHHPKLRARDLGKRLCEAPSMTKELDDLYKEYIHRCPEGDELSDACRALRHAPSPHHREPRRSILKDHGALHDAQPQSRRSSLKSQLVRFDADVDLISAITKVNGMEASLRETDGRLKLLRQLGGRITTIGSQPQKTEEKYPLHVRDPKKANAPPALLEWKKKTDLEDLEERTAKQDLARIYFTTEATKLMACATLSSLDRNTNTFKKTTMFRRPSFPHFFMDRLANEMEMETRKKKEDRLTAIKNEMDAFDEHVSKKPALSLMAAKFDPSQVPSEKSLNDLKLKVEIMKQQRERDTQAALSRYRARKSYFRTMLPCFPDLLRNDLLDYSIRKATKLCGEEMILASDFLLVAHQRDIFAEHRRLYDEEEEYLTEEAEEMVGENEKMVRDILDVIVDGAEKISDYKTILGKEPPESLRREWRDAGFALLNQQETFDDQDDQAPDVVCGGEGTSEEDTSQSQLRRISDMTNETQDDMKDASLSGRDDGDDTHARCVVTISTLKEPSGNRTSVDGKEVPTETTVQVKVTDCLHEDLESALTYDGIYLPVSDGQLTPSSSETQTDSSGTASGSLTDTPGGSVTECAVVQPEPANSHSGEIEYEEFAGEDEQYYDENGQVIIPVGHPGPPHGGSVARIDGELTEETEIEDGTRVGEVEIQAIDYSEDSPEGGKSKGKGLHFSAVIDKRAASVGEYAARESKSGGDSKVSLKDSIKFSLPKNYESKRSPIKRKKTGFHHKDSVVDDDDDDDDIDDDEYIIDDDGQASEGTRSSVASGRGEGMEGEENANEMDEDGKSTADARSSRRASIRVREPCSGPSKRKPLAYAELGNISYGMNSPDHEKVFLEHRRKELKHFSQTWEKGLYKPPTVFTKKEKNFVPYSNQYTGKRLPPFNILDPHIPRPKFNIRIKKLIRMAEQAKEKCEEEATRQELQEENNRSQTFVVVEEPAQPTCSEMFKDKRRPNWEKEIAEYECRRKEREKLEAEKEIADEEYAKSLGFEAFYNDSSLRQTFLRQGHGHVHILDDPNEQHDDEHDGNYDKKSSLLRKKTMACVPGPDGTLPDVCIVEDNDLESQEGEEEDEDEEEGVCQHYMPKYLEYPGEGYYEDNLEFQCENQDSLNNENFSIPEAYNE